MKLMRRETPSGVVLVRRQFPLTLREELVQSSVSATLALPPFPPCSFNLQQVHLVQNTRRYLKTASRKAAIDSAKAR